jgi:hypothetical protein
LLQTVPGSQRADGSDTVDLYYQLADGDNLNDTITVEYQLGLSGGWSPIANMVGDTGVVAAGDSTVHRRVRWSVLGQFGTGYDNDTIQVRVLSVDAEGNADTLTRAAADLLVDTKAPAVATSAFIVGGVVNSGAMLTRASPSRTPVRTCIRTRLTVAPPWIRAVSRMWKTLTR